MGEGGWLQGPVELSGSELELTLASQRGHEFTQGHVLWTDSTSLQPAVLSPATFPLGSALEGVTAVIWELAVD